MDAAVMVSEPYSTYLFFFGHRILVGVFFIPILVGSVIDGAHAAHAMPHGDTR